AGRSQQRRCTSWSWRPRYARRERMFCDEDRLLHIVWAAVELERPAHATLRVNHICAIDRGGEYEVGNDDAPTRGMALNIESDVRVGSGDADLDDVGAVTGEVTRREP